MIRLTSVGGITLVLVAVAGTFVAGADESAAELYGRGVHAYFSGDYAQAAELMEQSIALRPSDPRAYYFRGLACANLRGIEAGLADFQRGADVEYNLEGRPIVDINGALQRVQGALRLELEKVRTATRLASVERQKERDRVRYEELRRREDIVLFDPKRPAAPLEGELPRPDLGGKPDPFASGLAFSGGKMVEVAAPAALPASKSRLVEQPRDPFAAAAPEPSAATAPEDPFAAPIGPRAMGPSPKAAKSEPQPKTPGAKAAAEAANPFGEDLPKLDLQYDDEPPSPVMQAAGAAISVLGKAISSQATDRDPFAPPRKKSGVKTPPADATPAPPANETPKLPADLPADAFAPAPPASSPAEPDDDPFK